ncbi:hypothetical protein ASD34_22660 [Variovorax sp. Root473]|nr:hypothetical protein ASD34_22660 [Variovorax sp. Root473]
MGLLNYAVYIRSYKLDGPSSYGFGTFGCVTHHKNGFSKRRRLFLNAARICQDKSSAVHQINEGEVVQRLNQVYVAYLGEQAVHGLLHLRIEVDWIDHLDVLMILSDACQCFTDALKASTEIFPPMTSDKHNAL